MVEVKNCEKRAIGDIIVFFFLNCQINFLLWFQLVMTLQHQNMAGTQAFRLFGWHPCTLSCLGTKQFEAIKALSLIKTLLYLKWKVGTCIFRLISSDFSKSLKWWVMQRRKKNPSQLYYLKMEPILNIY